MPVTAGHHFPSPHVPFGWLATVSPADPDGTPPGAIGVRLACVAGANAPGIASPIPTNPLVSIITTTAGISTLLSQGRPRPDGAFAEFVARPFVIVPSWFSIATILIGPPPDSP